MKKMKTLFMAFALLGSSVGAWAQTDMTASVKTDKASWSGSGTYGSVTLSTGTTTPLAERYYNPFPCDEFPLKQTVSVDNGIYMATLYAHSNLAWISSSLVDGQSDYAYVYAKSGENMAKTYIVANRATGISAYKKYDVVVEVTDGSLELGLGLEQTSLSNWHSIQIYQLTKYDSYDQLLAPIKSPLKSALDEANSYYTNSTDNEAGTAKAAYKTAIDEAQAIYDAADTYEKAVAAKDEMETAIASLQTAYQTFALSGAMPTEDHPFDLTFTLKNPTFGNNNADGWTCSPTPGFQTFGNAEYYQTAFDISQTVTGLPQAYYKLKVKAFQRPGWAETVTAAYVGAEDKADGTANVSAEIYVNSGSQKIKNAASPMLTSKVNKGGKEKEVTVDGATYYLPDDMNSADKYFGEGCYENEIELVCTTGEAKMGFRCTETGSGYWTIFDDFRVYLTKPLDVAAYQIVYRNAIAEANRTIGLHPGVKGKEKAELDALVSAEEPTTIDALKEATAQIEAATSAYVAAEANWTRYAVATQTADKASVEYTNISDDATKGAADALAAANSLFVTSLTVANELANGKTLGFERGEYAPYAIGSSAATLAGLMEDGSVSADKVAAADAEAMYSTVYNIVNWAPNDQEVNAVWNGNFGIQQDGGWQFNGWGQFVSDLNTNTGASNGTARSNNAGYLRYGAVAGYSMPLKANTVYRLKFAYCSWDDKNKCDGVVASVTHDSKEYASASFGANTTNRDQVGAFTSAETLFQTGDAGDYVLTLYVSGNRSVVTDVEIVKATATDIYLNETEDCIPTVTYANVKLTRSFAEGWNGLVLPFAMSVEDAKATFGATEVKAFSGISVDETAGTTLKFADAERIESGVPVMIKVAAATNGAQTYAIDGVYMDGAAMSSPTFADGGVTYSFEGTFSNVDLAGKVFTLIQGSHFYNYDGTESSVKAKSYRAYFVNNTPEVSASKLCGLSFDGVVTGITEVKSTVSEKSGVMYDLQGRSVSGTAKGLYIKDGKKVIVK